MSEALQRARDYEAAHMSGVPETERPLFHATPAVGWMNDPNGFSFYQGEYHLFYQYYPFSTHWGPMHWGHMKTRDFLTWEYLPAALAPDAPYDKDGVWSGSAAELPDGRHLLIYTGRSTHEDDGLTYQTQCLAVGDGQNYEKYGGSPVLTAADLPEGCSPFDFRDPKIWQEPDGSYRVAAVTRTEDGSGAAVLFRSDDGFAWHPAGVLDRCRNEYGNMWECPDFFPLDGKQILMVSPMEMQERGLDFHAGFGVICMIGQYNGETCAFTRERVQVVDYGPDFYATQTMAAPDGRRILIAWMQNWTAAKDHGETAAFFGEMTVPRELSVKENRLIQNPIRELDAWRVNPVAVRDRMVEGEAALDGIRGRILDMTVSVRPAAEDGYHSFAVHVAQDAEHRVTVRCFTAENRIELDRSRCAGSKEFIRTRSLPVRDRGGEVKMRFVMDRYSLELFVNDGEQAASVLLYTPETADGITFEAEGGAAVLDVEKYELRRV